MEETKLRELFERAVTDRPPTPGLVPGSVQAGERLRRRRRIQAAAALVAAMALVSIAPFALAAFSTRSLQPQTHRPIGPTAYVAVSADGQIPVAVVPITLTTGSAGQPIPIQGGSYLTGMEAAPDGRTIYVLDGSLLTPIDAATRTAGKAISVPGAAARPHCVCGQRFVISPDSRTAYVSVLGGVRPVDLSSGRLGRLIAMGAGEVAMAPDGRIVYLIREVSGADGLVVDVTPISTTTGKELRPMAAALGSGRGEVPTPSAFEITPDGRRAYLCQTSPSGLVLVPFNLVTRKALPRIEVPAIGGLCNVAFTPDGRSAILGDSNELRVIDTATGAVAEGNGGVSLPAPMQQFATAADGTTLITSNGALMTIYALGIGDEVMPVDLGTLAVLPPYRIPLPARYNWEGVTFASGRTAYAAADLSLGHGRFRGIVIPFDPVTGHQGKPITLGDVPDGYGYVILFTS